METESICKTKMLTRESAGVPLLQHSFFWNRFLDRACQEGSDSRKSEIFDATQVAGSGKQISRY